MSRGGRAVLFLLLLGVFPGVMTTPEAPAGINEPAKPPAGPSPPDSPPAPPPKTMTPPSWWHDYQFGGYVTLAGTWEEETDGTNVKGLRLSFGPEGRVKNIVGKMEGWLAFRQGGDLDVYGVGLELAGVPYYRKWVGLGFLVNHGLEYRTESPHEGFGGFVGPGVEGIFWLGKHVQLRAGIEHDFGIGTRSRDVFRLSIGFGHRYWPPKIPKGIPIDDSGAVEKPD